MGKTHSSAASNFKKKSPTSSLIYVDRHWRQVPLVFALMVTVGAIYACTNAADFTTVTKPQYWQDECARLHATNAPTRSLLAASANKPPAWVGVLATVVASVALAVPCAVLAGVALLKILKHNARAAIFNSMYVLAALPAVACALSAVAFLAAGPPDARAALIPILVPSLLSVLFFYLIRRHRDTLELCANFLQVAAENILIPHPGLSLLALYLQLAVALVTVALCAVSVLALSNGHIGLQEMQQQQGNSDHFHSRQVGGRRAGPLAHREPVNDDTGVVHGEPVLVCTWVTDPWVNWYLALVGFTVLFATSFANEVRLFVVASITGTWFATGGEQASSDVAGSWWLARDAATEEALSRAVGPQRGTVVFAAIIVAIVIQYITRAATVLAAISGESLITSGRAAMRILRQTPLKEVIIVWGVPGTVLGIISMGIAIATSLLCAITVASTGFAASAVGVGDADTATIIGAVLGFIIGLIVASMVLDLQTSLLVNASETLFLLYRLSDASGFSLPPQMGGGGAEAGEPDELRKPLLGMHKAPHMSTLREVIRHVQT
ncbi:choline transporter-like protein [Pycnococcus provasolii]